MKPGMADYKFYSAALTLSRLPIARERTVQSGDWLVAHDSGSLIMGILPCRARVSHSRVGWPC